MINFVSIFETFYHFFAGHSTGADRKHPLGPAKPAYFVSSAGDVQLRILAFQLEAFMGPDRRFDIFSQNWPPKNLASPYAIFDWDLHVCFVILRDLGSGRR